MAAVTSSANTLLRIHMLLREKHIVWMVARDLHCRNSRLIPIYFLVPRFNTVVLRYFAFFWEKESWHEEYPRQSRRRNKMIFFVKSP